MVPSGKAQAAYLPMQHSTEDLLNNLNAVRSIIWIAGDEADTRPA
jgi:hypothetical protein